MERIVVLGGGESGCGSAVLARVKGLDVFLSDAGQIAPKYKALLEQWKVPYEEGGHTPERILSADRVVKSPGIPEKAPMVKAIREKGHSGDFGDRICRGVYRCENDLHHGQQRKNHDHDPDL